MSVTPYSRQHIDKKDILSVSNALAKDLITTGPNVSLFEKMLARYCKSKYAISVNSATSALHLACLGLGLMKNDYVWCSANSFVASSNAALYCGAKVDFVDINLKNYNICSKKLEEKLKKTNKKKIPKILIVTHIGGVPADMSKINMLSKKYKFKIIEDASHALGSIYKKNKIGSCKFSSICVFSFHPIKTITTGEGGACLTNNKKLNEKITALRSHGIYRNLKKKNYSKFYYEQKNLGYNYRLSDINAALGVSQLKRINLILKTRNKVCELYRKKLNKNGIFLQETNKEYFSSNHLFILRLIDKKLILKHKIIIDHLLNSNILINIHYYPIYLHPYYKKLGFKRGYCPNSEKYYNSSFSIPVFEKLSKKQQLLVCTKINKILKKYL